MVKHGCDTCNTGERTSNDIFATKRTCVQPCRRPHPNDQNIRYCQCQFGVIVRHMTREEDGEERIALRTFASFLKCKGSSNCQKSNVAKSVTFNVFKEIERQEEGPFIVRTCFDNKLLNKQLSNAIDASQWHFDGIEMPEV